jgi:hypothetical protein
MAARQKRQFFQLKVNILSTHARPSKELVMERLIVMALPSKPGRFSAHLESTGAPVVTNSKQPLVDGARELLASGFDPATVLTMRHDGSFHDSFAPLPIGKWAGWTYTEGETTSLRCARWMPRPVVGEGQKSGSGLPGVPNPAPEQKRLYEATFRTAA